MLLKSKFLAVALVVVPSLADPAVNLYFGQSGVDSLGSYCESDGFEYITLAFVTSSPENDVSGLGYPATNFAGHCAGSVYVNHANGISSELLSDCTLISDDITKCQALGKKVLLSIGGELSSVNNYTVSDPARGVEFADFMWEAFGPVNAASTVVRPFGSAVVDGFDFDIESDFSNPEQDTQRQYQAQLGYVSMIQRLRSHFADSGGNYIITGAPQCPTNPAYFQMQTIITQATFDILWVQFYNNPSCEAIPSNANWLDAFGYGAWEAYLPATASKDAKIFIGLPGSPQAAGNGYLEPDALKTLLDQYKVKPSFGGVMFWDANFASNKTGIPNGRTYYENAHDIICGPAGPKPTLTASTMSSPPPRSSSSAAAVSATSTPGSISTPTPPTSQTSKTSGEITSSNLPLHTSGVISSSANSVPSSAPVSMTTSTIYTTRIYTITSCPPSVPTCPAKGHVTTEVIAISTTVCPVSGVETSPVMSTPVPMTTGSALPSSPSSVFTTLVAPKAGPNGIQSGTGNSIKPTATLPTLGGSSGCLGTGCRTSATVSATKAVTAGAGRRTVAFGLPALMVVAVLIL
jgi:chitinase